MLFPITPSNPSIPLIWENFSCLPILYESELIKTSSFPSFLLLRLLLRACFLSPSFFMWNGNLWGRNVLRSRRCCVLFLSASLPLLQASHLTFLLVSLTPIQVSKVKIPRSHLNRRAAQSTGYAATFICFLQPSLIRKATKCVFLQNERKGVWTCMTLSIS